MELCSLPVHAIRWEALTAENVLWPERAQRDPDAARSDPGGYFELTSKHISAQALPPWTPWTPVKYHYSETALQSATGEQREHLKRDILFASGRKGLEIPTEILTSSGQLQINAR
jgi:hypothetical protein